MIQLAPFVRARVASLGAVGEQWVRDLPDILDSASQRWGLTYGKAIEGGSASYVVEAVTADQQACVLKVHVPADEHGDRYPRSVLAHRLADGRGCVRLLADDGETRSMLLERLGPNLDELGMSLPDTLAAIGDTLLEFWRPLPADCGLPTGPDQCEWLRRFIITTWDATARPIDRFVIDRALEYLDRRATAFDPADAVLVHGDAHGWNTLAHPDGGFRFVDPEGLLSDRAHDLSVPMREYNTPLIAGDTVRLVRERAEWLAARCDVDPVDVWEWGFIERVSTGLANVRDFDSNDGAVFLEVARRCC